MNCNKISFKPKLRIGIFLLAATALLTCQPGNRGATYKTPDQLAQLGLADKLEESLFSYILLPWYPRNIDTAYGGYISVFKHDWALSEESQVKALVQQARHLWTNSFVLEHYPDSAKYLAYASHGFKFLQQTMWDETYGGFHAYCDRNGLAIPERIHEKRAYGLAFAIYTLAQYFSVSSDTGSLDLAKEASLWTY